MRVRIFVETKTIKITITLGKLNREFELLIVILGDQAYFFSHQHLIFGSSDNYI